MERVRFGRLKQRESELHMIVRCQHLLQELLHQQTLLVQLADRGGLPKQC